MKRSIDKLLDCEEMANGDLLCYDNSKWIRYTVKGVDMEDISREDIMKVLLKRCGKEKAC